MVIIVFEKTNTLGRLKLTQQMSVACLHFLVIINMYGKYLLKCYYNLNSCGSGNKNELIDKFLKLSG